MRAPRVGWWLVILTLIVGLAVWILVDRDADPPKSSRVRTLAVLPFEAPASDPEAAHLATGLSLDLRRRLQVVGSLQLTPRGQILNRERSETDRIRLARELGAELLVLGEVRLHSGRVHLDLEIVDALEDGSKSGLALTDSRERIFELQRDAAREVATALQLSIGASESEGLLRDPTRSLKAWDHFVRGQGYLEDPTNPRGPFFAVDLFRRAIQHDPDFLSAHAGLGEALWLGHLRQGEPATLVEAELQARWALTRRPEMTRAAVVLTQMLQTASGSAASSLQQNPEITRLPKPDEALREVATGLLQVGRLELAEAAWRAAVELGGGLWINSYGLGQFFVRGGRFDEAATALEEATAQSTPEMTWPRERLMEIKLAAGEFAGAVQVFEGLEQPLADVEITRQIAAAYAILDRPDLAEAQYRHALALEPLNASLVQDLADVLMLQDRQREADELYAEGMQIAERAVQRSPSDTALQLRLTLLAAKARDCTRARPLATTLRRHLEPSAEAYYQLAQAFALCGETPMAMDSLQVALSLGLEPERIRSEPEFGRLAAEPGLQAILSLAETSPPDP